MMKSLLRTVGWVAFALIAGVMILRDMLDYRNQADFDPVQWHQAPSCVPDGCEAACVRGGMARDLQMRHLKPGTHRPEVIALLGNSESRPPQGRNSLEYSLGMCSGFQMDFDALVIMFDENDRLTRSWTEQH
ncbi:MAG: hypothetical protein LDL39_15970 [Magnetospirillum sp.]|nr:hypothetical protein [Magnetospirillum sp.]